MWTNFRIPIRPPALGEIRNTVRAVFGDAHHQTPSIRNSFEQIRAVQGVERMSHPDWELVASHMKRSREAILHCGLPLVRLSDRIPCPVRMGGSDGVDDVVTNVWISHGDPYTDGPYVLVGTSRWAGTRTEPADLPSMLVQYARWHGAEQAMTARDAGTIDVSIDGSGMTTPLVMVGDRWWGTRMDHADAEVRILARDWPPGPVGLTRVHDLRTLLDTPPPSRPPAVTPTPIRLPAGDDPAATLIQAALHNRKIWRAHREGAQSTEPPCDDRELWKAATAQLADITGQPEWRARRDLGAMIDQVAILYHDSEWFRTDERLRAAAVGETLDYWVRQRRDVPSAPAQTMWATLMELSAAVRGDRQNIPEYMATKRSWRVLWDDWATE